jgi:cell wall assembly regulator SMI1
VLEHADPQINPSNAYHRDWIQFAHDGGRTGLYLDLAPTALGVSGQVIFIDHDYNVGFWLPIRLMTYSNSFVRIYKLTYIS